MGEQKHKGETGPPLPGGPRQQQMAKAGWEEREIKTMVTRKKKEGKQRGQMEKRKRGQGRRLDSLKEKN